MVAEMGFFAPNFQYPTLYFQYPPPFIKKSIYGILEKRSADRSLDHHFRSI